MKLNKFVLAAAAFCVISTSANAADMGHGKITFKGSVIDAPCSIDAKSLDQTIQLGAISKNQLANGGKSTPVDFSIILHDCDTATLILPALRLTVMPVKQQMVWTAVSLLRVRARV